MGLKTDVEKNLVGLLNSAGRLLQELSKFDRSHECFDRAAKLAESVHGPEHQALGSTLVNLGRVYHDLAQYDNAEAAYKRALKIAEKNQGEDSLEVAEVINMLAFLLHHQHKFEKLLISASDLSLSAKRLTATNLMHPCARFSTIWQTRIDRWVT